MLAASGGNAVVGWPRSPIIRLGSWTAIREEFRHIAAYVRTFPGVSGQYPDLSRLGDDARQAPPVQRYHRQPHQRRQVNRAYRQRTAVERVVSLPLTIVGLALLALFGVSRWAATRIAPGGNRVLEPVLIAAGISVLLCRAVFRFRAVQALVLVITVLAVVAPFAPKSVRRMPVIHRVYAAAERIPLPWQKPMPAYVPMPTDSDASGRAAASGEARAGAIAHANLTLDSRTPALVQLTALPVVASPANAQTPVTPSAPLPPLPESIRLEGVRHQWQTWNNCGPASITMAASYFGRKETQTHAAAFLKPDPEDKNVRPDELVAYVKTLGLEAQALVGGDVDRLKRLLANNIPVVVEVWIAPEPNDWMGHYRLLTGYDDRTKQFIAYDSVASPGVNLIQPYSRFEEDWRVFNRTYIPVYTPDKAEIVEQILGPNRGDRPMYERALAIAQQEVASLPENGFAWFNLGSSLTALGRHAEAAAAFDKARTLKLPWRMLWYQFGPFEAYLAQERYADVLALTASNLQRASELEESHYYRGRALQAQGQVAPAKAAYQTALKHNPKYLPAYHALSSLGQ